MRVVIQRVLRASVSVDGLVVSEIDRGLLVFLGVGEGDGEKEAVLLTKKISELRIFCDENDKMNLSVLDVGGSVLVVSNFTLFADCSHGRRPSFIHAAAPDIANALYKFFNCSLLGFGIKKVKTGIFGADMKVDLINDGPVTIILDTEDF